ncbi:MAG: patatin-like phospholipase family protein, partial [Bacteroidota bacterium]
AELVLGEIGRGEMVGEIGLFTGEKRSATIRALRHSVVVRISKPAFEEIVKIYPQLTTALVRQVINWMRRGEEEKRNNYRLVNIAVVPISRGVDAVSFGRNLILHLAASCDPCFVSAQSIDEALNEPGIANSPRHDFSREHRLSDLLDSSEAEYDHLFLLADPEPTAWTERCIRRADEIILLGDAHATSELSATEERFLVGKDRLTAAPQFLVLEHHPATRRPEKTMDWLRLRTGLRRHYHLRKGDVAGLARLARIISGTSVGLVLSGGGAKGMAHIGVCRALVESGIPIDQVGGTSIGALIGAALARGMDVEDVRAMYRRHFLSNPTPRTDYNVIPLISILKGRKIDRLLIEEFGDLQLEDTWLPFFCVSTDLTNHRAEIHQRGRLWRALRASMSLPGILPPVADGDRLLVDGGVINNFPVDIMAGLGVGRIAGVEFDTDKIYDYDRAQIPATWAILRDRLRDRHDRKYRLPSLMSTVVEATLLNSNRRTRAWRESVDFYFNPPVHDFSMLNWRAFDKLEEIGYQYGMKVLRNSV